MNTKKYSSVQENRIANYLNGKKVVASGGGKFNKGDVVVDDFLIECKTSIKEKKSFIIKKEWIDKINTQSFFNNKSYWALAFDFGDGNDYYIIDKSLFKKLIKCLR